MKKDITAGPPVEPKHFEEQFPGHVSERQMESLKNALRPKPFVKHDGGKGCQPHLVPVLFRRDLRRCHVDPAARMEDALAHVEDYELQWNRAPLDADRQCIVIATKCIITAEFNRDDYAFLMGVARILDLGAKKYGPDNWHQCPFNELTRYFDAFYRHTWAFLSGEEVDAESGLHHLFHAGCCLAFIHGLDHIAAMKQHANREALREVTTSLQDVAQSPIIRDKFVADLGDCINAAPEGKLAERDRVVGALNNIQSPKSGGLT